MIESISESQGNIIAFRASGKLTDEDYKNVLVPSIEAMVKEHSKERLLLYLDERFKGWEPRAMWDDFKVGLGKLKDDFEKFALVGGPKWVQWAMKLDNFLMRGEVKTFSIVQLQDAWQWVKA